MRPWNCHASVVLSCVRGTVMRPWYCHASVVRLYMVNVLNVGLASLRSGRRRGPLASCQPPSALAGCSEDQQDSIHRRKKKNGKKKVPVFRDVVRCMK